ncbi:hypothetical protein RRG08_019021 [Elysia crispata]|uniref:Uncharacterized protein n=1 Tax=Elysia crispata TaxID=231223 RepID=A0AAE1DT58_9GAST|nr:hypothetical protein RRG08_019021 [Elysia crispata]
MSTDRAPSCLQQLLVVRRAPSRCSESTKGEKAKNRSEKRVKSSLKPHIHCRYITYLYQPSRAETVRVCRGSPPFWHDSSIQAPLLPAVDLVSLSGYHGNETSHSHQITRRSVMRIFCGDGGPQMTRGDDWYWASVCGVLPLRESLARNGLSSRATITRITGKEWTFFACYHCENH